MRALLILFSLLAVSMESQLAVAENFKVPYSVGAGAFGEVTVNSQAIILSSEAYLQPIKSIKPVRINLPEGIAYCPQARIGFNPTLNTACDRYLRRTGCTVEDYLDLRPDVAAFALTKIAFGQRAYFVQKHYIAHYNEAKICAPIWGWGVSTCSAEEYLNRRPDVRAARISARTHFEQAGIYEPAFVNVCVPPR